MDGRSFATVAVVAVVAASPTVRLAPESEANVTTFDVRQIAMEPKRFTYTSVPATNVDHDELRVSNVEYAILTDADIEMIERVANGTMNVVEFETFDD